NTRQVERHARDGKRGGQVNQGIAALFWIKRVRRFHALIGEHLCTFALDGEGAGTDACHELQDIRRGNGTAGWHVKTIQANIAQRDMTGGLFGKISVDIGYGDALRHVAAVWALRNPAKGD